MMLVLMSLTPTSCPHPIQRAAQVCNGDGSIVAHGGSPLWAGLTLADVVAQTNNHMLDAAALLDRFTTAARLGGGWATVGHC